MGWPKGKPRTGYIKKDGTVPAKRGSLVGSRKPQDIAKPTKGPKTPTKALPVVSIVPSAPQGKVAVSTRPVVEPCPNCQQPYADGGFCEACGWTQYRADCPHCKKVSKGK